jgi:hypothetical protein
MTNPGRGGLDKALQDAHNDCQGQARDTPLMGPSVVGQGDSLSNLLLWNSKCRFGRRVQNKAGVLDCLGWWGELARMAQ